MFLLLLPFVLFVQMLRQFLLRLPLRLLLLLQLLSSSLLLSPPPFDACSGIYKGSMHCLGI